MPRALPRLLELGGYNVGKHCYISLLPPPLHRLLYCCITDVNILSGSIHVRILAGPEASVTFTYFRGRRAPPPRLYQYIRFCFSCSRALSVKQPFRKYCVCSISCMPFAMRETTRSPISPFFFFGCMYAMTACRRSQGSSREPGGIEFN